MSEINCSFKSWYEKLGIDFGGLRHLYPGACIVSSDPAIRGPRTFVVGRWAFR